MQTDRVLLKDIFILTIIISLMYGVFLGSRPLTPPDEGRYAEIARQMLLHHDYVTPRINNIKYFEKPPLFYWMQALNVKLFGLNLWSVRIATALMGLLGCLFTYFAGTQLFNRRTGFLAAIILASSGLYLGLAKFVTLDMTVSVFIGATLLNFLLFNRSKKPVYLYAAYACAALATLTKGFIGIILPGGILFFWLLLTRSWREMKTYRLFTGISLFLIIALPWHIIAQLRNPEFLQYYVLDQQILRYFTHISGREQALWFLPVILLSGILPWTTWLPQAVMSAWRDFKDKNDKTMIMLLIWPALTFVFFWCSKSQLSPYILPMFPAVALLIAKYFDTCIDHNKSQWPNMMVLCVLFSLIGVVGILHYGSTDKHILINIILLLSTAIISTLVYWRVDFQTTIFCLAIGFAATMDSLSFSVPNYDARTTKPLAEIIKTIERPDDIIATYNYLYLDLPVYLNHNVTIVNFLGELKYGIRHDDVSAVWIPTDKYWQLWRTSKQRILMIMSVKDFVNYLGQDYYKMYVIAKTKNSVLISNKLR